MLHIDCTTDPQYMENGYVIHTPGSPECWIIDPGLPPHASAIVKYISHNSLQPKAVLLTHGHGDHIAGLDEIRDSYPDIAVYMAKEEHRALVDPSENLSINFGLGLTVSPEGVQDLPPGLELTLGNISWQILDTSGHSPGGRSIYCAAEGIVFVGDALFAGSIGRTDFHHSDHGRLVANLKNNLLSLPDETRVLSGHGPETTIGEEKRQNPFVGDRA